MPGHNELWSYSFMFVAQVINKQVSKNINTTLLPNYGTVNKGDRCKLCMNVLLHTFRNRMKQNGAGSDWCTVPTGFVLFTLRHQSPDQMQNESKCQTSTSALYNSLVVMGLLNWPNQETISKCNQNELGMVSELSSKLLMTPQLQPSQRRSWVYVRFWW